jgi:hypothetical protein
MIQDLIESGLLMKDIIACSGVNPTTLGWIGKGRVTKISGRMYRRIKVLSTKQVYALPVLEGEKINHAAQTVQHLLDKGICIPQICIDNENNRQTIDRLRKDEARRVLDQTNDRLRSDWLLVMTRKSVKSAVETIFTPT